MAHVDLPKKITYACVSQRVGEIAIDIEFEINDIDHNGMPILFYRCRKNQSFQSLEQAEAWLKDDPKWKQKADDVSVTRRFLINHGGKLKTLYHALHIDKLQIHRTRIGKWRAAHAMAPSSASGMDIISRPPHVEMEGVVDGHCDALSGSHDRSLTSAAGIEDDIVAKGARCAIRQLSAFVIDKNYQPLASALISPSEPRDLFLRRYLENREICEIKGNDEHIDTEVRREWQLLAPSDKYSFKARYWGDRVREATNTACLVHALDKWHIAVLSLCQETEPEGNCPPPTPPPIATLSGISKSWEKKAFREMVTKWLATEPWEDGVTEGSEFDCKFTEYVDRLALVQQIGGEWHPVINPKRRKNTNV